jgi:hypothetical protein
MTHWFAEAVAEGMGSSPFLLVRKGIRFHHFYVDERDGRLVIADHSCDNRYGEPSGPEYTDDGVLYLDFERPVTLLDDYRGHYCMPLKRPNGQLSQTIVVMDEVQWAEKKANRRFGTRKDYE